jgi:transcriptional repressor NrdR
MCPYCHSDETRVIETFRDRQGGVRRRRECEHCHQRFTTYERVVRSLPLIVKRDGTREEFDREKLLRGIRIACAKRPVSAEQIEGLADSIETALEGQHSSEVPSRIVGDRVMDGLKQMDQIAYVRFAIVYLQLNDLLAVRQEIDSLLESSPS